MPLVWSMAHQRGVKALPGYSIFNTPWAGEKIGTGMTSRIQLSTQLAGGTRTNDGGSPQNALIADDHYIATGTFKSAVIASMGTNFGIGSFTGLSGTQTVDWYAASNSVNNYAEPGTGLALTAGIKTFQVQAATKNAASTDYIMRINTYSIIRTGA